jgi:hypothetical protein
MTLRLTTALALALWLLLPTTVRADEHEDKTMDQGPQPITWIRFFTVEPESSMDFTDMMMDMRAELLDGMVARGELHSWGMFVPFTLNGEEDEWTHGVWATVPDWSGVDTFIARMQEADAQMSEDDMEEMAEHFYDMVEADATFDVFMRDVMMTDHTPAKQQPDGPPRFMRLAFIKTQPLMMEDAMKLVGEYALPTWNALRHEGVLHSAGMSVVEVVAQNDWDMMFWSVLPSLGAMDTIDAAFNAAGEARSEKESEAMMESFTACFEWDSYRERILRIIHVSGKSEPEMKRAEAPQNTATAAAE